VLFAWDLWNEVEPIHANNKVEAIYEFVSHISSFLRDLEIRIHGKAHLQTVSAFAPHLNKFPALNEVIFRHPLLDFATTHFYGPKALDAPANTAKAAICTGALVKKALSHLRDSRPFFDSEHGPIRAFRKRGGTLGKAFDEEYFRFNQWAHLASGGAGGGMRWPYRHPHVLTSGMRLAQKSMAAFCRLIDWKTFNRVNIAKSVKVSQKNVHVFACGDAGQAIIWLLRTDTINAMGMTDAQASPIETLLQIPLSKGCYRAVWWHTLKCSIQTTSMGQTNAKGLLTIKIEGLISDMAIVISRING
jgi:mannan endo-1,4-beta-mannosidase